jgi:protein-tyrosine-phosphatase
MAPLRVLFVCVENSCRSQMAEAFARHYGQERVEAHSAGSRPRGQVDATAMSVMQERGMSLASHTSKGLVDLPQVQWDAVVSMGCGEACPQVPARRRVEWKIPDPARQPLIVYRQVRDMIDEAVQGLVNELQEAR